MRILTTFLGKNPQKSIIIRVFRPFVLIMMDFCGFFQGKSSEFAWIPEIPYTMHPLKKSPILAGHHVPSVPWCVPSVPGTFSHFGVDLHINQAQMSQVSLGRPEACVYVARNFAPREPQFGVEFWDLNFRAPNFGAEFWGRFFWPYVFQWNEPPQEIHRPKLTSKNSPQNSGSEPELLLPRHWTFEHVKSWPLKFPPCKSPRSPLVWAKKWPHSCGLGPTSRVCPTCSESRGTVAPCTSLANGSYNQSI